MSELPLHVVIIGAGLGGACLAHGLKRAGVSVAVYEKESARRTGFFGFRLSIGPDGSRALRDALPPDLYQTFLATCAEAPRHLTFYTEGLEELLSTGLETAPVDGGDSTLGTRSASAMTLRQLLLTGIEDIVQFGKEFTHYEQRPDGRVAALFADGTSAVGDVLVGADGARSAVRDQYLPQADLQDCGFVAAYGQVGIVDAALVLPGVKMLDGASVVHGRRGPSLIMHPMEFKWDHEGELKSHVDGIESALIKTWSGLLYDDTRDHLMWGFMSSRRMFGADPVGLRGAELMDAVLGLARGWHPTLHELIKQTDLATAEATTVMATRSIEAWETTNVTLLGDAIHARIPDPGVGANATLHDAGLLFHLLANAAADRRPVVAVVREYETRMLDYDLGAVRDYRKCLNRKARLNRPIIGPVLAAGNRARLRLADKVPGLKKRVIAGPAWGRADDAA